MVDTPLTLSNLLERGCDLAELREQPEGLLTALGFSAAERETLVGKLQAMPADLSTADALAGWVAETEGAQEWRPGSTAAGPGHAASMLSQAEAAKQTGNGHFKAKEDVQAIEAYQRGVRILTTKGAPTAVALLVSCHSNAAACHVRLEQWAGAVESATAALALDGANVKARFRRGVACSRLGRMAEAKADLTAVVRAEPGNREARTVLEVVGGAGG